MEDMGLFQYSQNLVLRINNMPFKEYSNWSKRSTNSNTKIDPYKRFYILCEGLNTEKWYFEQLIHEKKELYIHSQIDWIHLEKEKGAKFWSNPKKLIEEATKWIKKTGKFDKKLDKMIIIFDADIFESQQGNYQEILNLGEKYILGVTNPSFELFLLLHFPNSYDKIIYPNREQIIKNEWVGRNKSTRKRYVADLFFKQTGMDPKKDCKIKKLASSVKTAIEQEKKINNDIINCKGVLTSNIGSIIKSMMDEEINE